MINLAVQKEAFPLAGLLSKVKVQTLSKLSALNLSKPEMRVRKTTSYMRDYSVCRLVQANRSAKFFADYHSAKFSAQNLTKPHFEKCATGCLEDFSEVTTRGELSFETSTREGFLDSIKKGSTENAALWSCVSVDHSSGVPVLDLRRSALSFRPQASNTHEEKLASGFSVCSRSMLISISSMSSCGNRMPLYEDLLFLCPVAIPLTYAVMFASDDNTGRVKTIEVFKHNAIDMFKHCGVMCLNTLSTGKAQVVHQIATPRSAETLPRRLTTTDRISIEVAVMNITTHPKGRDSLTPNKFTWRFLALNANSSVVIHIIATTET